MILSGGAINTPQLLLLSGIGPADHLADNGIATRVDNPHVGQVRGRRVADASVFPVIPRGNTHAPAMMVGEKAVDLIRETL